MLRAVLFDLDGTLLDHRRSAVDGLGAWCGALGHSLSPPLIEAWFTAESVYYQEWLDGVITHAEQRRRRLRDFLPRLGLPVPSDPELDVCYAEGFLAAYEAAWCGFEDAPTTLAALRAGGLRTGVLTNGATAQQNAKLRALGLVELLDVVVTSEEVGCAKPDARAFHAACRQVGAVPAETMYVGDNYAVDVLGARAAGLPAVYLERAGASPSSGSDRISTLHGLVRHLNAHEA